MAVLPHHTQLLINGMTVLPHHTQLLINGMVVTTSHSTAYSYKKFLASLLASFLLFVFLRSNDSRLINAVFYAHYKWFGVSFFLSFFLWRVFVDLFVCCFCCWFLFSFLNLIC